MCFTSVGALLRNAANALAHVQNYTTGVFHTAWFGKTSCQPQPSDVPSVLEHANRENSLAVQKRCVRCFDAVLRAALAIVLCREM